MSTLEMLTLRLRRQELTRDDGGRAVWRTLTGEDVIPARAVGILVCDVWDQHWCRGAEERVDAMAARINELLQAARGRGVLIIHSPSDTMDFYAGNQARERVWEAPRVPLPEEREHIDPPLPIDDSDRGCDTKETVEYRVWHRQHRAIHIDEDQDFITDEGQQVYSIIIKRNIRRLLYVGVHTNMCILNRGFGIKQMVRWGVPVALVRDLTDAMYNPAKPPYVSHDEGTQLVVGFIEKFWCPSVSSEDLIAAL
ncbi:MAG: cysteine hydrolase [Chloroflexi bacterium]|nr:cysteine hydrolase [Chloroflexota bacterium]